MKWLCFKLKKIKHLLILMLLFIWLVFSGVIFLVQMTANELDEFDQMMQTVAQNDVNAVELTFSKYISILSLAANSYKSSSSVNNYFRQTAVELVRMEDFSYINLVLPKPLTSARVLHEGVMSIERDFSEKMFSKQLFISDVYDDEIINEPAIEINVPIMRSDGKLEAYLVGVLSTRALSKNFSKMFYDLGGYFNIVDSQGRYIAASDSEDMLLMDISFLDAIELVTPLEGYDPNDVRRAFSERTEGMVRYYVGDESRAAYYSPININNWIIFLVVSEELIESGVWSDFRPISILIFNISCIFAILLLWVYRSQRDLKQFAEANEKNFHFMAEQTNKCIVEWRFNEGKVKITGRLNELFNIDANVATVSCDEFFKMLFLDDVKKTKNLIQNLEKGLNINDVKFRLTSNSQNFIWCSFSAVPISVKDNETCEIAIGFLENIHEQEEEAALLRRMSELDSLTQVYNRGTTEALIEKTIKNSQTKDSQHTLLIIDLDNFKKLNDTFGHQYGDKVIKEMASSLSSLFRKSDIVGRVGGDEFFVFMLDTHSEKFIIDKCNEVLATLKNVHSNEEGHVEVSASIGVAMFPQDGETFAILYHNADHALYLAKKRGKNIYRFFDAKTVTEHFSENTNKEIIE